MGRGIAKGTQPMTVTNFDPNLVKPGPPLKHCLECERIIPGNALLQHCDHCRPAYIASRRYLHAYAARVYSGWIPDKSTPAPMTSPAIRDLYMTAGDLADFN